MISAATLTRIAEFLEHGGRPLARHENSIARRVMRLADGDAADAAALLHAAAETAR